jgi:hypothetical protein
MDEPVQWRQASRVGDMRSCRIGPSAAIVVAAAETGAGRRQFERDGAPGARDLRQVNPSWVLSLSGGYQRNSSSDCPLVGMFDRDPSF